MCDPVTITLAATAVTMAGQGISALQANSQARYQAKIANRNAALENEAAAQAQANTREEALAHYRRVAALKGQQRVTAAANGGGLDFGSAADVQDDTDMLAREDVNRIYRQGFERARGFEINASNERASARAAKAAGRNAIVSGVFDMASTALGGAQQYSSMKAGRNPSGGARTFASVYGAPIGPA